MINFYVKSLKLANHLILTIPSIPPASLQLTEKRFNQTCFENQILSFCASRKIGENTKVNGKVKKIWIKVNTNCKSNNATTFGSHIHTGHLHALLFPQF